MHKKVQKKVSNFRNSSPFSCYYRYYMCVYEFAVHQNIYSIVNNAPINPVVQWWSGANSLSNFRNSPLPANLHPVVKEIKALHLEITVSCVKQH